MGAHTGERHAGKIMGYQMAVAYTGTTLLPPFLGVLAGYTTIGIFPLYILFLVAGMLLFSEILNFLIKGRSEASRS